MASASIARKDGARVRLYSRPGNDLTYRFTLIVESLARLRSRSCIIDGEAVCCDNKVRRLFIPGGDRNTRCRCRPSQADTHRGGLWAPDVKWALVCLILGLLFVLVSAQVPA